MIFVHVGEQKQRKEVTTMVMCARRSGAISRIDTLLGQEEIEFDDGIYVRPLGWSDEDNGENRGFCPDVNEESAYESAYGVLRMTIAPRGYNFIKRG